MKRYLLYTSILSAKPSPKTMVSVVLFVIALALLLSWVSHGGLSAEAWSSFFMVSLICLLLFWVVWRNIRREAPPSALWLIAWIALVLRLGAGCLWLFTLPRWGHGTPTEVAGYIMADAGARDQAAWKLSKSAKPLWSVFQNHRKVDQYGGFLFLSTAVYRYLAGDTHYPLLIVEITAIMGALAVLYTWAFTRRLAGNRAAIYAALGLCLYPEAVLIGSSQLREAFMIPLTASAFWGLFLFHEKRSWTNLIGIVLPLILLLPISPPFVALLFLSLCLFALALFTKGQEKRRPQPILWLIVLATLVLILAALWVSLQQFTPEKITNPLAIVTYWLRKSAQFQAHLSEQASGWMQKVFDTTPAWMHTPLLILYGVVQPFLPAALIVGSQAPIWRGISLWRSVGWAILLPFLLYAPFWAWRRKDRLAGVLSFVVWGTILVASLRGGGDMWDNPRYRAALAGIQLALAAWIWATQQHESDPWLKRLLLGISVALLWFIPWYLRRYYSLSWEVYNLGETIAAASISAILTILWELSKMPSNRRKNFYLQ